MAGLTDLAAILNNRLALAHPEVHNVDSLHFGTAAVAAQVEDKRRGALLLQIDKGTAHLFGTTLGKLVQIDVSYAALQHAVIGQLGQLDGTARQLEVQLLARRRAQHLHHEIGAGIAAQMTADVAHVLVGHDRVINTQNDVALLQPHLSGRHVLVRLVDNNPFQLLMVANQRTNAGILACEHHLEVLSFAFRIIFGIGVQRAEHSLDARTYDFVGVQGVDIDHIQILIELVEDVQVLGYVEVVVLLGTDKQREEQQKQGGKISFHYYWLIVSERTAKLHIIEGIKE